MKFFAELSTKNTLIVNMLFVFILVAGFFAIKNMQREAFPNVNFDMATVTTVYPGSTPLEIEKLITISIEKELKEVDDIKEITSISSEGISVIMIKIEEDAPTKTASSTIYNAR